MKFLKGLLFFFIGAIFLLLIIGYFLPDDKEISREIVINQRVEKVFPIINDVSRFTEWSPWHEIDPKTQYEYSEPNVGVGAKMSWKSDHPHVRYGNSEIVESIDLQKVRNQLEFADFPVAYAEIVTQAEGANTRVIWHYYGNADGNIIGKYFMLMLDSSLGPQYEKGLENLKHVAEQQP